nr:MAG TPA: IrrE protein [Caudoviricetes sp.]
MDERFQRLVDDLRKANREIPFHDSTQDVNKLSAIDKERIEKQATGAANKLVELFWQKKNAPLRIGDMLDSLGFTVVLNDSFNDDQLSGALAINNSVDVERFKKMIMLNTKDSTEHQRFTIAHELAHYIFDAVPEQKYYEAYYRTDEERNNEVREYRANKFAANLLMPAAIFVPRYRFVAGQLSDQRKVHIILSWDFGVSITAIKKRIKELDLGEK